MIIVLKNADFSANNIGKLEITTPIESKVEIAMASLTKYPCDKVNEYAQGLNQFYKGLVDSGIYNKITLLSLPIMSATIEEAGYNFITGEKSAEIPQAYALDENGELYFTGNFPSDHKTGGFNISHSSSDICIFGAITPALSSIGSLFGAGIIGWYDAKNKVHFIETGPTGQVLQNNTVCLNAAGETMLGARAAASGAFIVNYNGTDIRYRDSKGDYRGESSAEQTELKRFFPLCTSYNAVNRSNFSGKFFGVASALGDEEMTTLYKLIEKFTDVFE